MSAIPGRILRFLDQHANVAIAGTRDRHLVPSGHRVSGWRAAADGCMSVFVVEHAADRLVESLQDNGQFAVTIEESPSHETYQFKGRYLRHRPIGDGERAIVNRIRERFVRSLRPLRPDVPEAALVAFVGAPTLAVEFAVQEIFLQTPGPGAGARLVPPQES